MAEQKTAQQPGDIAAALSDAEIEALETVKRGETIKPALAFELDKKGLINHIALTDINHMTPRGESVLAAHVSPSAVAQVATGLSAVEWRALVAFAHGNEIEYRLQNILEQKGMLRAADIADDELTPLGRKMVAIVESAHASVNAAAKVEEINAREFIEQGYEEKVKSGECIVEYPDHSGAITSVFTERGYYCAVSVPNPEMVREGLVDPGIETGELDKTGEYRFTVTWLTSPTETESETRQGEGDELDNDILIDEPIQGPPLRKVGDFVMVDKTRWEALQTALTAASEREKALREAFLETRRALKPFYESAVSAILTGDDELDEADNVLDHDLAEAKNYGDISTSDLWWAREIYENLEAEAEAANGSANEDAVGS